MVWKPLVGEMPTLADLAFTDGRLATSLHAIVDDPEEVSAVALCLFSLS